MNLLTRLAHHLRTRPLLGLCAVAALAMAAGHAGALDGPVMEHLGNNPGNQGRNF
jgi:hypothetical protein